ncbi:MAG TPA: hypothetical protein VH325_09065 [Bryobacteraceae bacterium]|jgi:F0F1-type ATP synthase membrane subunit c/vacuolar-type H+-ATPase subunit K|nr:hypothetical protein [Bryobacteraceae bacterium]
MIRRNVDLIATAIVVILAGVWNCLGQSGLAQAIASGQVHAPEQVVRMVVHTPHPALHFHRY